MSNDNNKTTTYVEVEITIDGKPCPRPIQMSNIGTHTKFRGTHERDGRNAAAYGMNEFVIDIPKTSSDIVEDIRNDRKAMISKTYPVVFRYLDVDQKPGKSTTAAEVLFISITDEYDRDIGPFLRLRGIPGSIT